MSPHIRSTALTGSDQVVSGTPAIFRGYTLRNSHATNAATVKIHDHASAASGTIIATVGLAAGAHVDVLHPAGIWCEAGVFVDVGGTGTVEGSVRLA